jgi:hypothetical protein
MSVTATRILTKARTWLLVAGLTGVLIAVGAAIGGPFLYAFALPGRAPYFRPPRARARHDGREGNPREGGRPGRGAPSTAMQQP